MEHNIDITFQSKIRPSFASGALVRITQAILMIDGKLVKEGIVTQNVNDVDTKAMGQKWALSRAIETAEPKIPKDLRLNIWEKFKSHSKATSQLLQ